MLKGLRWPFLVLVLASSLLLLAVVTRPEETTQSKGSAQLAGAAAQPDNDPTVIDTPLTSPQSQTNPSNQPEPGPTSPSAMVGLASPENVLVEALIGEIRKLNPLLATYNPVDRDITSLIFEGLTTTNQYGEIVPKLAESWTVSDDGLTYIFVLRDDVLWQDGISFTAEDVVITVDLMSDPRFPGAPSLHEFWRTIEVDALGEHMVRFRLTQPLASFPDQLRIGIVPAHVLQGVAGDKLGQHPFNLAPIGTGPYQIETLTASGGQIDGIQLRVAPVYRQRPEGAEGYVLDRIVFRTYPTPEAAVDAFRRGEVNSISIIPADQQMMAQQLPGLSLYTAIEPHIGVLIYNWKRESVRFVRNPRARQALAHAVDREFLVTTHLPARAIVADSPLLPNSWAYEPGTAWPVYDLAQAQAMLDAANLVFDELPGEVATESPPDDDEAQPDAESAEGSAEVEGESAIPLGEDAAQSQSTETPGEESPPEPASPVALAMTILTLDDPTLVAMANDIASGWEQLGFTVSVEAVDATTLQNRLEANDFDVALIELSFEPSADPDPYVFWHQGQYGTGQNYGGMDDRRLSETLELARRDSNGLNRIIHYQQFQRLFAERAPALVLYYPLTIYATDSRLQGIQLGFLSTTSDRFRTIQNWTFTN